MKKRALSMALALALLLGSSMNVCAEEAGQEQNAQPQVQNYQQIMTPEILASFTVGLDQMDETILKNALVCRTDVWGTLQDADGDGIDDRDPINGCGYLDLNCNGFDDRLEMAIISELMQQDPREGYAMERAFHLLSHSCKHGIIYSDFYLDKEMGCYWSLPDYFRVCEECMDDFSDEVDDLMTLVYQLDLED